MTAAKNDHADAANEHLDAAEQQADQASLSGYGLVLHKLEVAFVHALAGAETDAHEALAAAEAEIAKFSPNLDHLKREISLLIAKVHAALARK